MSDEHLVFTFMPALVVVLTTNEKQKGRPLTEEEVYAIRDGAVVVAAPVDVDRAVADERGYDDIDPENAWQEWQIARRAIFGLDEDVPEPEVTRRSWLRRRSR